MSTVVVTGTQWGDEGKGKIVDYLAQQADTVVRFQGGSNAGHTVVVNDEAYKLRLMPSGILFKGSLCVVGNGVAFDLTARSAAVEGKMLPLTRSEYAICEYLALHAGQTFTKEQIYEAVFGIDGTADDTAVTQHIKNIRAKLRAAGVPEPEKLLNTVWGVGYRWKSED